MEKNKKTNSSFTDQQKKKSKKLVLSSSSEEEKSDENQRNQKFSTAKSSIPSLVTVENKIKKLQILLNKSNEILLKKEKEIRDLIKFLDNNNCEITINIINKKHPHSKICSFCFSIIGENCNFGPLDCCPNEYVHKGCIIDECAQISPELKESELNYRLRCQICNTLMSFEFLKHFLKDKFKEINNQKKSCIFCECLKPQNEIRKKFCDHYYCSDCLNTFLRELVMAREVNFDQIKCKSIRCDALLFNENDFKTQHREKYYKADDFYAAIAEIKKNDVLKRCVGSEDCPKFIKNSPKPEYLCLNCEDNLKKIRNEKIKEANPPPFPPINQL